jgi:hypothetical protein
MENVRGFAAPGYEEVKGAFAQLYEKGWEKGSAFTAFQDGKLVCSLSPLSSLSLPLLSSPY